MTPHDVAVASHGLVDALASHGVIPVPPAPWQAHLALEFARIGEQTKLVRRQHRGPLVVQKTLYPEPGVCQAVVVHPPGGIAGGDRLELDVCARTGAHAQLITPGAAKWYRTRGPEATQRIRLDVSDGAAVEWLPHDAIVFDGAAMRSTTTLHLEGAAVAMLWDIVCLGRSASNERFTNGLVRQRLEVVRDDRLLWIEQNVLAARASVRSSTLGLAQHAVFGTFLIAAPLIHDHWLQIARDTGSDIASTDHGVTRVPGVLIARCRTQTAATMQRWFRDLWRALRPEALQRPAVLPRLWST